MDAQTNARFAEARRRKGLTQSQLADAIGCKQSAVSMFENGRKDALSRDKLAAIAKILDVDATKLEAAPFTPALAFCPDPQCPSNVPYALRDGVAIHPTFVAVDPERLSYCALCGEVMETRCPNPECRSAPQPGAFCRDCGSPYIAPESVASRLTAANALEQQQRTRSLLELTALLNTRLSGKETQTS